MSLTGEVHHEPRLLAVDDSALIHRLLVARLKSEEIEIHGATTGDEGLVMAKALQPDVILLDIDLPQRDGFEVLEALKTDPRTMDIPVIMLSASPETDHKVRALEMGAIDFIAKPFDLAELRARVRSAIRLRTLINLLETRANIDGLTGLANRNYFDERLAQEVEIARRHGHPLSLIMCDLDRFKSINDTYGHSYGDKVLIRFARLLTSGRRSDVSCRYGGEEFAIILPDTSKAEAVQVAERARALIRQVEWEFAPDLVVTASFGVTDRESAEGDGSPQAMLTAADAALYSAKRSGRDRVIDARSQRLTA